MFYSSVSNFYIYFSDISECATNADNCDANAACTNTPGSFDCTCNQGYTGDGVTCVGRWNKIPYAGIRGCQYQIHMREAIGTFLAFVTSNRTFILYLVLC